MTLDEIKSIAEARNKTSYKWPYDGVELNSAFIVMAANKIDALIKVAEAAKKYVERTQIAAGNQFGKSGFNTMATGLTAALAELEK